jgi:hypothetical protein
MIIRLIAIDPAPRAGESDVVVYQVPEHSRAHELLEWLMDQHGIEHCVLAAPPCPVMCSKE